ncbi:MAG TPA: ABC transporter substrate-binding protein [Candidatus Acidoferrales bacterium]|nr:ABC transporter substrate-binding protein [Candidatus Acidoferrales bacterium]
MKNQYKIIGIVILAILVISIAAGITLVTQPQTNNTGLKTAVISYAGGTCEAPVFIAYEKGFFKDEGLNVTLIQAGFEQLKISLDSGAIDATQANFAWFKPIEQGFNIKLAAGIHTGCISLVTPNNSGIHSIADLKGKAVGVDSIGGGPQIALSAKLRELGINPTTEIQWKAYPSPQLDEAINKGEIVAYMTWDPFPSKAVSEKGYINLFDIGKDAPFNTSYCCFVGINGNVVQNDPEKAAAITRAILKAAQWVGEHPEEAAQISIDKGYVGGNTNLNARLLASYDWEPSISKAKDNIRYFITEQKAQGILDSTTNVEDLYNRVFAQVVPDSEFVAAPAAEISAPHETTTNSTSQGDCCP